MAGTFRYADAPSFAPPGPGRAIGLHARLWLRRLVERRLVVGLGGLAAALAAALVARGRLAPSEPRAAMETFASLGLPALALVALGLGISTLRRDADHGALDAFLLRPRAALALPVGRWAATTLVVTGFGWTVVALGAAGAAAFARPFAPERLLLLAVGLPLGAGAYVALFQAFATLGRAGAAISMGWWLLFDFGLSRVIDGLARVSVRPALELLVGFDTDLAIAGDAGREVLVAAVQLVLLAALGLAWTLYRLRGDAPGGGPG